MTKQRQLRLVETQSQAGLSAEADHRIANSLAVIAGVVRLRASKVTATADPKVFLREIADRIETVGKLHRHIAHSRAATVQLDEYLHEICETQSSALAPAAISFLITCPSAITVPFKVALPLGLITAELISNSLKYAHPTGLPVKISLSCCHAADELTLAYEDDGIGFPEGFDASRDGHLGMRFVRLLSEQLRGTHNWASDPLGIRFEIRAPLRSSDGDYSD